MPVNDDDKVVSLTGEPLLSPGQPVPEVVEALEGVLELARSGEVNGVAIAYVWTDGSSGRVTAGERTYALIGVAKVMVDRMGYQHED